MTTPTDLELSDQNDNSEVVDSNEGEVSQQELSVPNDDTSPVQDEERVDLGNHEADVDKEPPHVNDEGQLVDSDGNKVFTTTEQAIKDGSFVLDAKGRMPGVYLDDLENLQRRRQAEAYEAANKAAAQGTNSVVERQVNVVNSGLPPVTVVTKQEHPLTGDAKNNDAEVPLLENDPNPAE